MTESRAKKLIVRVEFVSSLFNYTQSLAMSCSVPQGAIASRHCYSLYFNTVVDITSFLVFTPFSGSVPVTTPVAITLVTQVVS